MYKWYTQDELDLDKMERLADLLSAQYESSFEAHKRNMDALVRLGTEIASNPDHGRPDLVDQYLDLVRRTMILDRSLFRAKMSLSDLENQK